MEVCNKCGLPMDLCVCQELEKEDSRIIVRLEMRRFRKPTTIIEGLASKSTDVAEIAKKLKNTLACGGSGKGNLVILQGDHRDVLKAHLINLGFSESSIEVQ